MGEAEEEEVEDDAGQVERDQGHQDVQESPLKVHVVRQQHQDGQDVAYKMKKNGNGYCKTRGKMRYFRIIIKIFRLSRHVGRCHARMKNRKNPSFSSPNFRGFLFVFLIFIDATPS